MRRLHLVLLMLPFIAGTAIAQDHSGHDMSAHDMGNEQATDREHTVMPSGDMAQPGHPSDGHTGHSSVRKGSELPVGQAAPPSPATVTAADQFNDPTAMKASRNTLRMEHGGARVHNLMIDMLEYQSRQEGTGYAWDAEGWFGTDEHRLVIKTEGEGTGADVEAAEVQLLYSRPIGVYTDLQAGLRHDFNPTSVTYAAIAIETMLPYWFELEAALFVSEEGDVHARATGVYDFRLTQRLILQPRAELNFSLQDVPQLEVGSGLSDAELGLRLRYEICREFAPYIGVSFHKTFGGTADFLRASGEHIETTSFVAGLKLWL